MKKITIATMIFYMGTANALTVIGILEGKKEIVIRAKSQGEVTQVNYEAGQKVSAGDIIAIIDEQQEEIERDLAETEFDTAKQDYLKTEKLKKFVSSDEITQKKNLYLKKKSILELKDYNFNNTRVTAPFEGVITKRFIKQGETVKSGDETFEVMQLHELVIELDIEAPAAAKLKNEQLLEFTTELHGKRSFQAQIYHIGPVIDKASGTIKVRLRLDNIKENEKFVLMPGTMVNIKL